MNESYVHGYASGEASRLQDQATTLIELLHADTAYPDGHSVLEAGCGVGAQTVTLARNSPRARFTSVDVSESSVAEARRAVQAAGLSNVALQRADIFDLPFAPESFDHVFVCFVLEHLAQPVAALKALKHVLKPGGSLTVIECDHRSAYFYPDSEFAKKAIDCLVQVQFRAGGNAHIGRSLYPLLTQAGLIKISVSPRMVYVDSSKPEMVEGFTKNTFTAMVLGVRTAVIDAGFMSESDFDLGIRDLYRTAEVDGVFCYTFFKAVATYEPKFTSRTSRSAVQ